MTVTVAFPMPGVQSVVSAGIAGAPGAVSIVTVVGMELQPSVFLMITLYVPGVSPGRLFPGRKVTPLSKLYVSPAICTVTVIVPVAVEQVGCVIVTTGADGDEGTELMTTFAEAGEVQPAALVTVKECVPGASPLRVVLAVFPVIVPGLIVQLPAGRLFRMTLPVETAHEGCVIVPMPGAVGAPAAAFITTPVVASEIHPDAFVTVK